MGHRLLRRNNRPQTLLRLARFAAGYSLRHLGAEIGRSAMWISRLERGGTVRLTQRDIYRISVALNAPRESLFNEEDAE